MKAAIISTTFRKSQRSISTPAATAGDLERKSSNGRLNAQRNRGSKRTMKKILTFVITLAFGASAFAGQKQACCATDAGKKECSEIYAKLNLTPEQKSKLDALQARCEKDSCKEESMKKFFHQAKKVLSPQQYTQLKTECGNMGKTGAKAGS